MSVDALDLYQADRKVGRLFDERPLRFVYDGAWLGWPAAHAIAQFRVHRGGESRPGHIGRGHLDAMARELGFSPRYVAGVAQALVTALPPALETVQADLARQATAGTESTLIERLGQWIRANTRKLAKRWELPG